METQRKKWFVIFCIFLRKMDSLIDVSAKSAMQHFINGLGSVQVGNMESADRMFW